LSPQIYQTFMGHLHIPGAEDWHEPSSIPKAHKFRSQLYKI